MLGPRYVAEGMLSGDGEDSKNMRMISPIGKYLLTGLSGIPPVGDIV